uniref:Si:dkeyp-93d12.1 n=1 Tax=Astyanax mexicanus TaxID=7994 RepID=A0A8B9KQW0_ASTMX
MYIFCSRVHNLNSQYLTICELDYNILQVEIQNAEKTQASLSVSDFCLVEDVLSSRWYRGRVQNKQEELHDVFLLDYGNVLTVSPDHLAAISDALLVLPPKIVCGFFANVLPIQECWDSESEKYFSSMIGTHIRGFIHGLLPYKVFLLEAPDITKDLVQLHLGRLVDTDSFLLLVEMLLEMPVQQSCQSVPDLLLEKRSAQEFSFKSSSLRGFENILSLSQTTLAVGQKEKARVTAAVNPELFYCQPSSVANDLIEMTEKLAIACESRTRDHRDAENLGLLCAVKGKDEKWHRGFVQCLPVSSQVRVMFVDYGYCEFVKVENVLQLPSQFLLKPTMAYPCSLSCLNDSDENTKCQQLAILKGALLGKEVVFTVDGCSKEQNVLPVTLSSVDELAQLKTVHFDELKNSDVNKYEHILDYFPEKSCKSVAQKPDVSRLQEQHFSTQNVVVEKQAHTQESHAEDIFRPPKIQLGSEISVLCTHVTSPSDFWCQNKKHKDDLDRLINKLQDFYQTHSPVFLPHSLCCAVKFHQDNMWYRGLALEVSNEDVEVILVDYGMVVKDSLKNIRALLPEFIELETQAFRCSLYNLIEPVQEKVWSKEACTFFKDLVSGSFSNLTCSVYSQLFVVNKGICNVVDLHTPHQKASSCLVEKGVAVEISYPKELVPSAQACSFVYSSFNISIGSEELVYATHVDGPWEIYLQLDRNSIIIDELMESIQKESEKVLSQAHSTDNTGPVCLAKYFGDTKWYRAISWPAQSSQHLNVFFVDYGNKQVAEKDSVLPIPRKSVNLLSIPMQALRCSLSDVPEREHLPEVNAWLKKTIINRAIQAKFVAKNNSGHFLCELFDGNLHINEKVKELFAIQGDKDAVSSGKRSSDCSKEDMNLPDMGKKFKTKDRGHVKSVGRVQGKSHCRKASKVKLSHVNHNQNSRFSKDDQSKEINDQKSKKNQISRNVLSEKSHMKRTFKIQTSVLPKMRDLPNVKIKLGSRGVGYISHCNSAERFFIQMEKDEQTILKIGEDLNSSLFTDNMQHVSEVNVGDLVAAKYEDDMALYRAVVTNIAPSGVLTVEFVDYGNTATINRKNAYLLTSQFLSHARLSIPCTLSNPEAFQDTDRLMKEAHDKALIVEFVRNLGNSEQSVLGDTYTEDLMDDKDQVQHLFFAPVQMDVEYSGFAAAVITPGEFYIVLEDLLLAMNAVSNILEGLPEVLSPLPESHLICGTGCLVRCGEKNKWCRAELVQCDDDSVIINLVDYGHYAHIPRQDINKLKKLPSELARLPKITYPCLLRGVKSTNGSQWSDSAVVFFQKCMAQGNLQIYFRHYVSDAQWEIDVVTEGRNIAKDLVDAMYCWKNLGI